MEMSFKVCSDCSCVLDIRIYSGCDLIQICECERHCGTQDSDLHDNSMVVEKDLGKDISANADIHRKQSNLK
jgi:hypothetical protein